MSAVSALLAYDIVAGPAHSADGDVAIFVHGILGSRGNWKSFARRFLQRVPAAAAVLVDLRHHGDSHGLSGPNTVAGAADDIDALCGHLGLSPTLLVGHSWGGKAMLELGLRKTLPMVSDVVVVDSPPGIRTFGQANVRGEIERVLEALQSLPAGLARDRKHLVDQLVERGLSGPIAQWMTTNLTPLAEKTAEGLGFRFKFNLEATIEMLHDYGRRDFWPALMAHTAPPQFSFVRGARSDRWTADELGRLRDAVAAGVVVDHVLPTGHWVHTDDPEGLLEIVVSLIE
jgi:pimeloyl-ACP methyl ester carboxylesterase